MENLKDTVKMRKKQRVFRDFIPAWFALFFFSGIYPFLLVGPELLNVKAMAFLFLVIISASGIFYLLVLSLKQSEKKAIERVIDWGGALSYRAITENSFSFPNRIFTKHRKNGAADFVLQKDIAGMTVRLFQYSHVPSNGNDGVYSVISISTKDELPSFNLFRDINWIAALGSAYQEEIHKQLNKEIPGSSRIPFQLSNGEKFSLWTARKFEIEALQIFSEEIVEYFSAHWSEFLIIGEDKSLMALSSHKIKNEAQLKRYDELAHFLVDKIALRIGRIGKSVEEMEKVMGTEGSHSWS